MIQKFVASQFGKFLLSGGLAAAVNFASRFFFSQFVSFEVAVALAFVCGMLAAFVLMRTFVFVGGRQRTERQLSYFFLVNMVGMAVTLVVSALVRGLADAITPQLPRMNEAIGHLVGIMAPVFLSYYAHKRITFR